MQVVTAKVGFSEAVTTGEIVTFCSHHILIIGEKDYDFRKLKEEYKYLSDLPNIRDSMTDVKITLGQDAYQLIRPLEYKPDEQNQPWAVKTALGSTISGALPFWETSNISVSFNVLVASDPLEIRCKNGKTWRQPRQCGMSLVNPKKQREHCHFWIEQQNISASVRLVICCVLMTIPIYPKLITQLINSSCQWKREWRMTLI